MKDGLRWGAEVGPETLGLPSLVTPNLVRHWDRVLRRSRRLLERLPEPTGPTVLFVSTLGRKLVWPARAAVLAYAARLRGARPVILTCDRWLEACEEGSNMTFTTEEFLLNGPRKMCDACFGRQKAVFDRLGFPHHHMSQFHTPDIDRIADDVLRAWPEDGLFGLQHHGMEMGPHIESSILRFFQRNTRPVGRDYDALKGVVRRYARAAIMLSEVCDRAFARLAPDVIVSHFGCYVSRGVPPLVARRRGIRAAVLSPGYHAQAWTVGQGMHILPELGGREHGPWETLEMTPAREAKLQAFLDERVRGRIRSVPVEGAVRDESEVLARLALDPRKPLVSLFSSIGWDAKSFYDTPLYPNVEDWVFDSIRIFAERPGVQLAVRIHPAETLQPTRQPLEEIIARQFPALPPNVRIVSSKDRVSSYTLADLSQACIVYGTTLGIELSSVGKPVIVAGRAPYWRKGFTYDVLAREDYVRHLDRLEELARPDPARQALARRFAYYRLFMREIHFRHWFRRAAEPVEGVKPWWRTFRSLEDLLPGRDPDLDAIVDSILTGREAVGSEAW
jgi:hypothetical protein